MTSSSPGAINIIPCDPAHRGSASLRRFYFSLYLRYEIHHAIPKAGPWCHRDRFQNCWDIHVTLKASSPASSERWPKVEIPMCHLFLAWKLTIHAWCSTLLLPCSILLLMNKHSDTCPWRVPYTPNCITPPLLVLKKHYWRTLMKCSTVYEIFLWNLQFSSTSWLSSDLSCVTQLSINIDFWI